MMLRQKIYKGLNICSLTLMKNVTIFCDKTVETVESQLNKKL